MRSFLVVALVAVGCTKKQDPSAAHRDPLVFDARAPAAPSARPPVASAEPRSDSPHEPRFDPVAVRKSTLLNDTGKMRLVDVGDRVIVMQTKPVAMAVGDGPLVLDPKLSKGLDDPDSGVPYKVEALAGTWPDIFAIFGSWPEARGVHFELPLMRFGDGGWSVASNAKGIMPTQLQPFGMGRSLVLGWSTDDENGVPAGWSGSSPIWQTFDATGVRPAPIKTTINRRVTTAATQDGNLFVFGEKAAGLWLAHYRFDGAKPVSLGEHALPGSQACTAKALDDSPPILEMFVAKSGIAIVSVPYPVDGCKKLKPGIYEDSEKGFAPVAMPLQHIQIVGAGEAGTLWVWSIDPDGLFRVRLGKSEAVPMPTYEGRPCTAASILEHGSDVWMIANCERKSDDRELLFRFGRTSQRIVEL